MKYILTFCALFIFQSSGLFAQGNDSGEKLYKRLGYKASIPQLQGETDMDLDVMAQIANSYRLNHDTQNAELWYAQVVESSQDPTHFLYYAQALQSNGKRERAKQYYIFYDEMLGGDSKDRRGELLAAAVDRMNEFQHTDVTVENVDILNTGKLDFSPAYYNDGVVFVSTRAVKDGKEKEKTRDIWIDDNFMCLFFAKQNTDGLLAAPEEFCGDLTTKFHEGPVSFTRSGDQIFFTRNHFNKGKRKNNSEGIMKLQIYTATRSGDSWTEPTELPFNTVEYEEAHPSISPDGTQLFFASERPGGFGGMDIYVSNFQGGAWSDPINLGDKVNTAGNEIFPFVHDDGSLYFASNGWGGLGGLDIFKTQKQEGNQLWRQAENIGTPFNSPKDDFGLVTNVLGTEGYFTSARDGGHGKDDIYHFVRELTPKTFKTIVCTYRNGEETRIEGVAIELQEKTVDDCDSPPTNLDLELVETENNEEYLIKLKQRVVCNAPNENMFITNEKGESEIPLFPDKEYVAIATKGGYEIERYEFSTKGKTLGVDNMDFCIPLNKLNCTNLVGVVKNKKYDKRIPYATVNLINMCTGENIAFQTDQNGDFNFPCIECGCEFKIKGSKEYFTIDRKDISTIDSNCAEGKDTEVLLELLPDENAMLANGNPNGYSPDGTPDPYGNSTYTDLNNVDNLREGAIIELKNIFYDFDKYYIREGAAIELDLVVDLLQRYSGMVIELSSHTDARGSDKYNKWLSRKRAKEAVAYITSKGIDARRLVAAGYGETQLRNSCANFVECTEEEHQFNRRTEIKIIKFDRSNDIDVKYIDNAPEKVDPADPKRKFTWK